MFDRVAVFGCGGTGGYLIEPLARLLHTTQWAGQFTLCDGDRFAERNLVRQPFPARYLGRNKAEVHAERLQELFGDFPVTVVDRYVDEDTVAALVPEATAVFACVDNHPTRVLLGVRVAELDNGLLIAPGNELLDGSVVCHWRRARKNLTQPLLQRHPELGQSARKRARVDCATRAAAGETQLLPTNLWAAAASLYAFYRIYQQQRHTKWRMPPQEVYFDLVDGNSRTQD